MANPKSKCSSKSPVSWMPNPTHVWSTCVSATERHIFIFRPISGIPLTICATILRIHYIRIVVVCGCATHGKCHARVRSTWYPVQPCAVVISGRVHPSTFRNSSTYTSCKTHHWSNHSIEKFQRPISIWAPAFIYFDDKKMWRQAGLEEMLVSPRKRDQNEMGGLQKRDTFWCLLYLSIGCYNSEVRRNWGGKKTGPKRDQNEVWTRSDHWYLRMQYKWYKIIPVPHRKSISIPTSSKASYDHNTAPAPPRQQARTAAAPGPAAAQYPAAAASSSTSTTSDDWISFVVADLRKLENETNHDGKVPKPEKQG